MAICFVCSSFGPASSLCCCPPRWAFTSFVDLPSTLAAYLPTQEKWTRIQTPSMDKKNSSIMNCPNKPLSCFLVINGGLQYSVFVILRSPLVWPGGATTLAFLELRSPRTFQGGLVTLRSWYQNLDTKILVPRSWYQDLDTKIVVPRFWYRDPKVRSWLLAPPIRP